MMSEVGTYKIIQVGWVCDQCGFRPNGNSKHRRGCHHSYRLGQKDVCDVPKSKLKSVLKLIGSEA
jgi:hypothetical protein